MRRTITAFLIAFGFIASVPEAKMAEIGSLGVYDDSARTVEFGTMSPGYFPCTCNQQLEGRTYTLNPTVGIDSRTWSAVKHLYRNHDE